MTYNVFSGTLNLTQSIKPNYQYRSAVIELTGVCQVQSLVVVVVVIIMQLWVVYLYFVCVCVFFADLLQDWPVKGGHTDTLEIHSKDLLITG